MKEIIKRGATSNILRVFLLDTASTTGAGKTALTNTSTGLIISTIADNEATATTYTAAATNVETVTTLGTFAAPTAGKCRFREVDATNFPGVYEIHIADARYAVASSTQLLVSVQCTGVAPVIAEVQLIAVDLMDTVRFGLTAIPNVAQGTTGAISTGNATGQVTVATNNDKTGYSLTTAPLNTAQTASAVWDALLASYTTANSFGARVVRTRSTSPSNEVTITGSFHIAADVHEMQPAVIVAADFAAGAINANALATDAVNEIADGLLLRSLATAGAANNIAITSIVSSVFQASNSLSVDDQVAFVGTAPVSFSLGAIYYVTSASLTSTTFTLASTLGGLAVSTSSTGAFTATEITDRNMLSALRYLRNKVDISGSTMTVYQEDDTTAAWNAALTTTAGVNPVTSVNPS
jgi:hypothetical protein